MEFGHFSRRKDSDSRDRNDNRTGDGDRNDNRTSGGDRNDNRTGGGDRNDNRTGGGDRNDNRGGDRGGFRERGGERNDRSDNRDQEDSVFSKRVRAGKRRTYFLDVRQTKGNDYFITITESTRREDGFGYKRHKIFLYKEDFNRFVGSLNEVVDHVKTTLMPDFDYEEFDRRQAEWEAQNRDAEGPEKGSDERRPSDEEDPSW